ncbi:MAG: hypothetical protein ACFFCS_13410 [Candidatus Hodarchaeota archaeon]
MPEKRNEQFKSIFWKIHPILIAAIIAIASIFLPTAIMITKDGSATVFNLPLQTQIREGVFEVVFITMETEMGIMLPSIVTTLVFLGAGGGLLLLVALMKMVKKGDDNLLKTIILVAGLLTIFGSILHMNVWYLAGEGLWLRENVIWFIGLIGPWVAGGLAIMAFIFPR